LKNPRFRERLCASSILISAALALSSTAARAQAPAPPPAEGGTAVQEVVVTGTLVRRTNVETPSPVTVLSATQLANQGISSISDAVRSISADNSGTIPTAFSNGFASGSSAVALRGLTVNSTLVLIDGLRTANYALADDGQRGFVDLNTIPFSIVDRVEVLKDGASSTYGADAIGGVVNIITKKTFEGFEGDASIGDSQHGGGFERRLTLTLGHGDLDTNRFNAYVNFEYQQDDAIHVTQRGFPYNTNDLSSIGGANNIAGQPGLPSGSIYGTVTPAALTSGINGQALPGAVSQVLRAGGCGVPTRQAVDATGNVYCAQDMLKYQDFQPQESRMGGSAHFTYQLTPDIQLYLTGSYYENKTVVDQFPQQLNTSVPVNTNAIALPYYLSNGAANPNLAGIPGWPVGQAALLNYAFGDIPSQLTEDNHVERVVAGLKGSSGGWDFAADFNINHTSLDTNNAGYILYSQLVTDINTGAYNFLNPAANSAGVRAALSPLLAKTSTTDLDSFDVSANRKIYDLPGGPLSIGIGAQVRYEGTNDPDLNPDGTYQGLGVAHTIGHRLVEGTFFEVDAPLLKQLEIDVSGRYDHYSDFGGNFSPKVGFKFTPVRQFALRGTFSEGFRAPSFSENGSSASEGFVNYSPQTTAAVWAATHNNDAYTQTYSLAEYVVANPKIRPETSQSYTLGFIAEPTRWLNFSLDYYQITKEGVIGQSSPSAILNAYYAGSPLPAGSSITVDGPDPQAPGALPRPLIVQAPYVNANSLFTDGIDLDLRAHFNLPGEVRWVSDLNATDMLRYRFTSGGVTFDYVGTQAPYNLSSGAGTPRYRASWTNTFTWEKLTVSGTLNYTSSIKETGVDVTGDSGACLYAGANNQPFPNGCIVKDFYDFDLTGSYQITPKVQIYANVLNLFDALPPLDPADYAGGGANYNPTYAQAGIIGRFFKIGVHVKY
jgi:iron complex outermembrane receptor protein